MPGQNAADDGFYGMRRGHVEAAAARREFEPAPTAVRWIEGSADEPAALEPVENPRERARVKAENRRETARSHPRSAPEDPERHALRAREADRRLHPLREGLKPVVERPDEAHELEDVP
jgi:hypothetical protein